MMKCDPRAFAQCPDNQHCSSCADDAFFTEGSECDKFTQSVLSKLITNADRIRAKSDAPPVCGGRGAMVWVIEIERIIEEIRR